MKFKVGDTVRCVDSQYASGLTAGQIYVVKDTLKNMIVVDRDQYYWNASRFELVEDQWSEWESHRVASYHSQWYEDCDYEKFFTRNSMCTTSKVRIKLKPVAVVKVSDLKGTVEMKDGKPDWSTYEENS